MSRDRSEARPTITRRFGTSTPRLSAAAFTAAEPGSVPPEVGLFEAVEAGDAIPAFSFTALTDGGGRPRYGEPGDRCHPAAAGADYVLPIIKARHGSALMDALLPAADAAACC
jgi:hypothetical protein